MTKNEINGKLYLDFSLNRHHLEMHLQGIQEKTKGSFLSGAVDGQLISSFKNTVFNDGSQRAIMLIKKESADGKLVITVYPQLDGANTKKLLSKDFQLKVKGHVPKETLANPVVIVDSISLTLRRNVMEKGIHALVRPVTKTPKGELDDNILGHDSSSWLTEKASAGEPKGRGTFDSDQEVHLYCRHKRSAGDSLDSMSTWCKRVPDYPDKDI